MLSLPRRAGLRAERRSARLQASAAGAILIRRMRGTDLAGVIALDRAAVVHNHRLVPLLSAPTVDVRQARCYWSGFRRRRNTVVFVAVHGRRPVGMLGVDLHRARNPRMQVRRWVYLHSLYVDPCARGRRLAQRLIRHALAWSCRRGAGGATLEMAANNDPARALYLRFGFTVQEVTMARRLRQSAP
jgi:ribosomal protein S18 acetylase RimI-like enzyme